DIDLLLNQGDATETDFYPYRYLATEGFLPGYNFPRLPLRTLLTVRDASQSLDRARFLGLSEFGPWNVIYHEGRKHRVTSLVLPAGGLEPRITAAQLCKECGFIHPDGDAPPSLCEGCGVVFDADTRDYPQGLLEQSTARARPYDRISSDEEDRSREGYEITTHYRFAQGVAPEKAVVRGASSAGGGGTDLMRVEFAPRADLWRINHGWRRSAHKQGFSIDPQSGWWGRREEDEIEAGGSDDSTGTPSRVGIKPYVTENRNLLLLRPLDPRAEDEAFLKSLAYALQRGIQVVYQIEEHEVAVELIGRGQRQRLLLWEAAEGGTGVWDRIMGDAGAMAEIAREALRTTHVDERGIPEPEWEHRCALACYDCLLSYANQRDHHLLDRRLVRDYLVALAGATLLPSTDERDYDAHYRWLLERIDPASTFERSFLDTLHEGGCRLPDEAQRRPTPDIPTQPDFYYERDGRPGVCVFVDGPAHLAETRAERDRQVRASLEDFGYTVVAIGGEEALEAQIARRADGFGRPAQ
ncbi:MAG: DUF1998 domain-containing protein, partial [Thermomicrobiales bacterium]|nr:DUF1998 domain-containing protein [Thermomicrobiales bacterium]